MHNFIISAAGGGGGGGIGITFQNNLNEMLYILFYNVSFSCRSIMALVL